MSMSQKDYREAAQVVRDQIDAARALTREGSITAHFAEAAAVAIAVGLADMFARDNARFDRQKFYAAAGVEG